MTILLLTLLFLVAYPFVIYPLAIRALRGRREPAQEPPAASDYPSVAMVICALNEGSIIREKIENSLALEYPGRLRIVVVNDGSTDRTAEVAREYAGAGLDLIDRQQRRGKVANLNAVIPELKENVVVLSDANVIYASDAVLRLVERLRDPSVGCVSGKVMLVETTAEI